MIGVAGDKIVLIDVSVRRASGRQGKLTDETNPVPVARNRVVRNVGA